MVLQLSRVWPEPALSRAGRRAPEVISGGCDLAVGSGVPGVVRGGPDGASEAEFGAPEVVPGGRDLAIAVGVGVPESVVGLEQCGLVGGAIGDGDRAIEAEELMREGHPHF